MRDRIKCFGKIQHCKVNAFVNALTLQCWIFDVNPHRELLVSQVLLKLTVFRNCARNSVNMLCFSRC